MTTRKPNGARPSRSTIRVRPHSYQPTKAEMEEPVTVRKRDGSLPTPEELAAIALRPVTVIEDPKA